MKRKLVCSKCGKIRAIKIYLRKSGPFAGNQIRTRICKYCRMIKQRKYYRDNIMRIRKRARERSVFRRYGIVADEALKQWNGVCDLCDRKPKIRHIDHDHNTGKFRGILCNRCNTALGFFLEKHALLRKAADYVERGGFRRLL